MKLIFMNTILLDILVNFTTGVLSSFIFVLVILRILKPKIKISNKICFKNDENGNNFYFLK